MPYLGCWIHAKVLVLGVVLLENWELIATVFLKKEEEEDAGAFIFRFILSLVISRKVGKSNSSYIVFGGIQCPTQSLARKHISTTWIPLFPSQKWIFSIKVAAGTFAHALPKGVPHCRPEWEKKKAHCQSPGCSKCTLGTSSIRITQELVRDLSLRHQRLTESRCACTCGAWNGTHI